MKKHLLIVILGVLFVSLLYAAGKNQMAERSTVPTVRKITGNELYVKPSSTVDGPHYRPAIRQSGILFVEDPAALGPPSPDQYWSAVLDSIVGSGNYGWFAVETSQTANGPSLAIMQGYDLIIWNTYDTWNSALGPALTATDQTNIANYIAGGGKVWLIGQDILYSGVSVAWMTTNFELQSVIEDYNGASGAIPYPVAGVAELSGLGFSFLVDWGSDVFADALTPTANAHHVIQDVAFPSYYPSIVSNDYTTSFWTVDGRNPTPWADWQDIVYIMLDNFGVLGVEPYVWDFEDGLQGWTHTNGQPFPAGWDVEPSGYYTAYAPPDPGDSTMWVDSDAGGSAFWIQDTALSPAVVPADNMVWLKYGYCNFDDADPSWQNELRVGLRYFTSGVWNTVELVVYPANVASGPGWDSVDVSAYATADSVRVYFYFDDLNTWGYVASFDNVGLYPEAVHDVGCTQITSPPPGNLNAAGDYDVIGRIRNFGDTPETFDAVAIVYDTLDSWNVIFTQTATFTDFPVDGDSLHDFGVATFLEDKIYCTKIYTTLSGDVNPANDTSTVYTGTLAFNIIWNFETGWQGWTHTNGLAFPAGWDVQPSGLHSTYTPPAAEDSSMWIDSDAAGYVTLYDTAYSPTVVPTPTMLQLKWGIGFMWYSGGNSEWVTVGVRTFTGGAWQAPTELRRYQNTNFGPAWDSVDVSAYQSADSIKVFFSYNDAYYEWYVAFDNVMLDADFPGIAEEPGSPAITRFGFAATMPTMAKGRLPIAYSTAGSGHVSLKVYDRIGRLVQTLVDEHQPAGEKSLVWNGMDINNRVVANGVYFLRLEADDEIALRKLVLVR